jgi:hypothetical protein
MTKIFLTVLLLALPFASAAERGMCNKMAQDYAMVIANMQYPKTNKENKAPFKINTVNEVTESHLLETGKNKKQIAEMQKIDPVEIYAVSLLSADKWDCLYYVTVSVPVDFVNPALQQQCRFRTITAHHCAK